MSNNSSSLPALNLENGGHTGSPAPTPSTPITARKRGFGLFSKRHVSNDVEPINSSSTLTYQPRIKSSVSSTTPTIEETANTSFQQHNSTPSTPRASTSSTTIASPPIMKRTTPGRIQISDSALLMEKELNDISDFQESQSNIQTINDTNRTPSTAIPLSHSRRQQQNGTAGIRNGKPSEKQQNHQRKSSWIPHHSQNTRQVHKRRLSSPLDYHANETRRESIPGAKPVTSSFHPDAPVELKVKPPSNPVLLPFLSIPGTSNLDEQESLPFGASPTSPPDFKAEDVLRSSTIKLQRPAIKVRIITWNQGSSVPKGNLEVLLGRVGEYIPPQEGWDESSDEEEGKEEKESKHKHRGMGVPGQEKTPRKERIPPLPHDDAHPYHVVVIAGQECPWGDGKRIATGVGLAGELGDLSRSKSRAAQLAREKPKEGGGKEKKESGKVMKEGEGLAAIPDEKEAMSAVEGEFPFSNSEQSNKSIPSTPAVSIPTTPGGVAGMGAWGIGGKGWSDMCEDWLCRGPLAQATATKGLAQASKAAPPSPLRSPAITPIPTPEDGLSPVGSRSATPNPQLMARNETTPSLSIQTHDLEDLGKPKANPSNNVSSQEHFYSSPPAKRSTLAVPKNVGRSISFVSRSREANDSITPTEERLEEDSILYSSSPTSRPMSPLKQSIDANVRLPAQQQKALPGKAHHRLGLHIPGLSAAHHVTVQSDGTPLSLGAYELVAKERCYMMYMAVYVWRGCLDRVAKTSQGHVKSGLLAGRVGNKGAVGISLKLGSSRLLFVNAHLAAHEGKVAERVANVEKIKKELKVDTFLPPEDPRNKADDVTAAFDYAFWCGDLNFRVDISRQHADWLLMKKQYQDALAFDQLTKIMKEQPEVFNGFQEAPITFPPTFKYDVLKTIKQKREEKAKKQRNAVMWSKGEDWEGNTEGEMTRINNNRRGPKQDSEPPSTPLQPTTHRSSKVTSYQSKRKSSDQMQEGRGKDGEDDTSSISSSGWGGSAFSTSAGNHSDREDIRNSISSMREGDVSLDVSDTSLDPVVSNNTAAAEGHKLHGKAIKVKRRFFDVVQSFGHHTKSKEDDVPQIVKTARLIKENSKSQEQEGETEYSKSNTSSQGSVVLLSSDQSLTQSPSRHSRSESYSNLKNLQVHARSPIIRRRSSAGDLEEGSPTQADSSGGNVGMKQSPSTAAMAEEYERQPYDTSAKQRVPSWCDRVLWKSNIKVEEEEEEAKDQLLWGRGNGGNSHGLHSRMGTAISNVLGPPNHHRRNNVSRSKTESGTNVTFAPMPESPSEKQRKSIGSPQNELPSPNLPSPSGQVSSPRRRWFYKRGSNQQMKRSTTMEPHDLSRLTSPNMGIGKRTMSELDLPSLDRSDSTHKINSKYPPPLRPRTSSLDVPRRRMNSTSPAVREQEKGLIQDYAKGLSHSQANPNHNLPQNRTHHVSPSSSPFSSPFGIKNGSPLAETVNRRTSWWNDHIGVHLPSFLTPQVAFHALNNFSTRGNDEEKGDEGELIGPTKGDIECLLYKSLDDREMRLLEGRSDHRPVIWVGNVGI